MTTITVTGPVNAAKHELRCFSNLLQGAERQMPKSTQNCYFEQNIDPNCRSSEGDSSEQIVLRRIHHHGAGGNFNDLLRGLSSDSDDYDSEESCGHESDYDSEDSESESEPHHVSESDSDSETESEKPVISESESDSESDESDLLKAPTGKANLFGAEDSDSDSDSDDSQSNAHARFGNALESDSDSETESTICRSRGITESDSESETESDVNPNVDSESSSDSEDDFDFGGRSCGGGNDEIKIVIHRYHHRK